MNMHSTSHASRPRGTPAAILAKSAVCVALVVGVAWIGLSVGGEAATDLSVNEAGTAAGVVIRGDRAAAHRRQVFDERRARFEGRAQTQVAGASRIEYPMP
jgi:hypothetical protein